MIISLCQERNNHSKIQKRGMSAREARRGFVRNFPGVLLQYSRENCVQSCKIHRGRPPLRRRPPSLRQRVALVRLLSAKLRDRGTLRFCTLLHAFSHAAARPPPRARDGRQPQLRGGAAAASRDPSPPAKSKMSLKTRWGVLTPESSHDVNVPGDSSRRASRAGNMVHNVTQHNIT